MNTKTTFLLFTIALIYSCNLNKKNHVIVNKSVTFEKDIKTIAENYCGGYCHYGQWTDYAKLKQVADNGTLYKVVIKEKSMPKNSKLPKKEFQLINDWLETGAKEK